MTHSFELFIARRYIRAKRKQAVISVITVISVVGVAAGVMALIIGLAINSGFRNTLQSSLLGATAHITVQEKDTDYGITGWRELTEKLKKVPHVVRASPSLYGYVMAVGGQQASGAEIKGVPLDAPPELLLHLKQGSFARLRDRSGLPGIILGSKLAEKTGMMLNSQVKILSPQGNLTPMGMRPSTTRFRVVGIFESGFYDIDVLWAYTDLQTAQGVLGLDTDVVNAIDLTLDDIYRAPEVAAAIKPAIGKRLIANTWMEQFHQILGALKMEKIVTAITIGLIQLVAALNILITLSMMVMEKSKDIAILMSMGARREQIRRIFLAQGLMIGVVGTAIGLVLGYALCFFANHYQLLKLDADVYAVSYVPFAPRWIDALWIAATAIFVSFFATLYPARSATRIAPAEALRYE